MLSDIIKLIMNTNEDNKKIMLICKTALAALSILAIIGIFTLASTLMSTSHKAQMASTHYNHWYEQLPDDSLFKQEMAEVMKLSEVSSVLGIISGAIFDSSEEIIKYQLGQLDITELGVLDAYVSKKLDEAKPEYLLFDIKQPKSIKSIKMVQGDKKTITLYRNGEELSFTYVPASLFQNGKAPELHQLISLGFVKPYVENPEIACIVENEITAVKKGNTKLILIYGTQLIECPINVK